MKTCTGMCQEAWPHQTCPAWRSSLVSGSTTCPVQAVLADVQGAVWTHTGQRILPIYASQLRQLESRHRLHSATRVNLVSGHSPNVHLLQRSVIQCSRSHCLESAPDGCMLNGVGQLFYESSGEFLFWRSGDWSPDARPCNGFYVTAH